MARKRYILFHDKRNNETMTFPTIVEMYNTLGVARIGQVKNALYNALVKNKGSFENQNIKIEYKNISNFTIE